MFAFVIKQLTIAPLTPPSSCCVRWSSLCIEADHAIAAGATKYFDQWAAKRLGNGRVFVHAGPLQPDSDEVAKIFDKYNVPYKAEGGVDFIKVDIDNIDSYVFSDTWLHGKTLCCVVPLLLVQPYVSCQAVCENTLSHVLTY